MWPMDLGRRPAFGTALTVLSSVDNRLVRRSKGSRYVSSISCVFHEVIVDSVWHVGLEASNVTQQRPIGITGSGTPPGWIGL